MAACNHRAADGSPRARACGSVPAVYGSNKVYVFCVCFAVCYSVYVSCMFMHLLPVCLMCVC